VNRIFIHLKWKINEKVNKVRADLMNEKEIIIVYDKPWFWKISAEKEKIKQNNRHTLPTAPLLPIAPLLPTAPLLPIAPLLPTAPTLQIEPSVSSLDEEEEEEEIIDYRHKQEPKFNVKEYISQFPSSNQLPKKKKINSKQK
jgi:hypothetical protein